MTKQLLEDMILSLKRFGRAFKDPTTLDRNQVFQFYAGAYLAMGSHHKKTIRPYPIRNIQNASNPAATIQAYEVSAIPMPGPELILGHLIDVMQCPVLI